MNEPRRSKSEHPRTSRAVRAPTSSCGTWWWRRCPSPPSRSTPTDSRPYCFLLVASFSCVLTEHLFCRAARKESTIGDWSAAVTGLLYGLTLPPSLPLWMAAAGGFFAIGLGKTLFGGLGYNVFNPALVGRAVVQGAFPVAMTTWSGPFWAGRFHRFCLFTLTLPFMEPVYDSRVRGNPSGGDEIRPTDRPRPTILPWDSSAAPPVKPAVCLILLGGAYSDLSEHDELENSRRHLSDRCGSDRHLPQPQSRGLPDTAVHAVCRRTLLRSHLHGHRHGDLAGDKPRNRASTAS